jgi:hypothetical protein
MAEERPRKRRRSGAPRRWHRYLGAIFALPLLWLVVSGLLLQHQEKLGLSEKKVSSAWLLKRYDQIPEGTPTVTSAGRFEVAGWGGVLFVDDRVLEESGILVYDSQGDYLDRLGEESLPAVPIMGIGLDDSRRVHLKTSAGQHVLGEDFLDFEAAVPGALVKWNSPEAGEEEKASLQRVLVESSEFTWSRVITDLHSGSLLGKVGRFLVDLTGLAVIVLTVLGIRLLFKRS